MAPKYTATITPFDNFAGRSKVRFGAGERLDLSVKVEPTTTPPVDMEWVVKAGNVNVHNKDAKGTATAQCGPKGGAAVLELRLKTGAKTVLASKRFEVVAPEGAEFIKISDDYHVAGAASAGFVGQIRLLPTDVSFKGVEMREGAAPFEGSGCFKEAELKNAPESELIAKLKDSYAYIHPVMGAWVKIGAGNKSLGADTVTTAVSKWAGGGKFVWNIPWFYRVVGFAGDFKFTTAVHKATVDNAGTMTVSKLNLKVTRSV